MKVRAAFAAAVLLLCVAAPRATAQVLPPPPPIPAPPAALQPLLELLAAPGGVVTEPGCAALGTVLGLGAIVIPGLPGTVEQQTGLPLSGLPVALQPELLSTVNTLLFVEGSGCGLLPLAAERTVCASDDEVSAQFAEVRKQLNLPGLPLPVGDFTPTPAPTAGAIVDTFRGLARLGVPGAAQVVAAMEKVGDCGLRPRVTNVVPPPLPPDPAPGREVQAPQASPAPHAAVEAFNQPPVVPRTPVVAAEQVAAAPASARGTPRPTPIGEPLTRWLQWLVVGALVAFLYRAIAPQREQS